MLKLITLNCTTAGSISVLNNSRQSSHEKVSAEDVHSCQLTPPPMDLTSLLQNSSAEFNDNHSQTNGTTSTNKDVQSRQLTPPPQIDLTLLNENSFAEFNDNHSEANGTTSTNLNGSVILGNNFCFVS